MLWPGMTAMLRDPLAKHTDRVDSAVAVRTGPVRAGPAGLLSLRPQPLPAGTRPYRWLPHVLVILAAVLLTLTGADRVATVLAGVQAASLVVALRWPVPAWWLSTAMVVVIAVAHPPTPENELWAWCVQAGTVFLIGLRNRLAVTVAAAVASCALAVILGGRAPVAFAVVTVVLAAAVSAAVHSGRSARERLAEQEAVAAQERARRMLLEERARIARELHDVVAHHMSVIAIQADAAPLRVPQPPAELVEAFAGIRGGALEGLGELRRILHLLRSDPDVTHAPAPSLARLEDLIQSVRQAGHPVSVHVSGVPDAAPGIELSAYRIVQEALSNAMRHAPGAAIDVEIACVDGDVRLRVTNTAPGEAASMPPGTGHGLIGMRERAEMLGGELAAAPTADGGFEVTAHLPGRTA